RVWKKTAIFMFSSKWLVRASRQGFLSVLAGRGESVGMVHPAKHVTLISPLARVPWHPPSPRSPYAIPSHHVGLIPAGHNPAPETAFPVLELISRGVAMWSLVMLQKDRVNRERAGDDVRSRVVTAPHAIHSGAELQSGVNQLRQPSRTMEVNAFSKAK